MYYAMKKILKKEEKEGRYYTLQKAKVDGAKKDPDSEGFIETVDRVYRELAKSDNLKEADDQQKERVLNRLNNIIDLDTLEKYFGFD